MSLLAVTSGSSGSSLVAPEGTEFDGVTDYLSRSTDLTGNVDSKTFTFSCWVYRANATEAMLYKVPATWNSSILITAAGSLELYMNNSTGNIGLNYSSGSGKIPINSFVHILISIGMTSTATRFVYINDILVAGTYQTFINSTLLFKASGITVTREDYKGRLSHLYLDYTYRDLSIEANRRLFITSEGFPA